MRPIVSVAVVALFLLAPLASAPSHAEDDEVVLALQENVEIEELLRSVGRLLDIPVVWDPGDKQIRGKSVQGAVDIRIQRKELLGAVRSLLTFYELVIVPVGGPGHEVLLVMDARRTTSILKLKAVPVELNDRNLEQYEGADGLYVTTMIKTEHMDNLMAARNALTRLVTGQNIGNVTEVPDARALVVQDFAPNVAAIYRVVKQMDAAAAASARSTAGRSIRAISLKHADVATVYPILVNLFPAPPAQPVVNPNLPPPSGPRIQADDRTNQVLVTGTAGEIEQVSETIAALDVPAPAPAVEAHLLRLEHLDALRAAGELTQLVHQSKLLWRDDERVRPTIVASAHTNALLVSADPTAHERIRNLVREMDEIAGERKAAADDR